MGVMKTVVISEFKAKCIALLKEMNRSGEPLTVTLRGKPLALIEPAKSGERVLGAQKDETQVHGDIVHFSFEKEWDDAG